MASNKNQHFVPKCYLRPFTVDNGGAAINLYNVDRRRFICNAPAKNQCSGDYFFGKDEQLEKAIQSLEGEYAAALHLVHEPGYRLTDEHRHLLGLFWLFQYLRTEGASRRVVEMNEGIGKTAGIDESSFRLEIRDAVQMAMKTFVDSMGAVSDLKVCLVRNRTRIPFITSDDPAVLTNRWYLTDRRTRGMSFGLGSAGAILFLPLSPQVMCIGYDGAVYSVPHEGGWAEVRRQADIEILNEHQCLNCRANLFVQDVSDAELVHETYFRAMEQRPLQRHRINYAVKDLSEDGYDRYTTVDPDRRGDYTEALIHIQAVHPIPSGWPSLLRWRPSGYMYTNGTGAGYCRRSYAENRAGPAFWRERVHRR